LVKYNVFILIPPELLLELNTTYLDVPKVARITANISLIMSAYDLLGWLRLITIM
jgi:hypothetical protein